MTHRLLSIREVLARICISKTNLYRSINIGEFPRPVPIGRQRVAFIEAEVEKWIAARLEARERGEGAETRRNRATKASVGRSER